MYLSLFCLSFRSGAKESLLPLPRQPERSEESPHWSSLQRHKTLRRRHFHAAPERDMVLHTACRGLGIGVVPRRIGVLLAVHHQGVVARLTLPGAA